ncbi:unnamed protein product [Ilex paraguariensis]|uniref:Uncharacterized protein n=1 Tax=Ilex paraguariensis TaxID=185542 RepID=A0ABC8RZK7_9AQUA
MGTEWATTILSQTIGRLAILSTSISYIELGERKTNSELSGVLQKKDFELSEALKNKDFELVDEMKATKYVVVNEYKDSFEVKKKIFEYFDNGLRSS